ncbi:MAG: glycosyltransferase family 4 protein, partial [Deltaproteobacteria bacterium]|nr:glycosyltransferase family 4 protein [Deltaproteobacteria bacterium]
MKLLFINYEFPPLGGGGGNANEQIARHLAALGHEVVVLTSRFKGLPREETRDGYRIVRIPTLRRYQEKCWVFEMAVFMFSSIFYAPKWARRWRPDRCIAFFTLPSAPAAWVIKKIFGVPYIVSLRGGDVPGFLPEQLRFYHRITAWLIRFLWKGAESIVANSEGLKRLALGTGRGLDIAIIPNGVDAGFFRNSVLSNDKIPPLAPVEPAQPALPVPPLTKGGRGDFETRNVFRILTAGRLTAQKGIDTLLQSFCRLKPSLKKPVQLWIVGDGPLRSSLEDLTADLGIRNDVFFLGWRDRETLKTFYSSADLFILPSLDEGMPNVVLEAMAMGLPIVATNVAGTRELVREGKNGYLVPPKNPEALADILSQLISRDDLLQEMSRQSRLLARQYDWKAVALEYLRLCETAA